MKKYSLKFVYPLITLLLAIYVLNISMFGLPAMGKLTNPFDGFQANEKSTPSLNKLSGTKKPVKVTYDERHIPHIFAQNDEDMYTAQGYVTANDRLWQIDFLSLVAAGRLAEVLGKNYVEHDRLQRRYGIMEAAKRSLKVIESNPVTKMVMDNYTRGVNAHISELTERDYPIEYKLIGYKPEPWTNLKSVLIMKYVGSTLTGYDEDVNTSFMRLALKDDFDLLYPDYALSDSSGASFSVERLYDDLPYQEYIDYDFLGKSPAVDISQFNPRLGSNAWALSNEKTAEEGATLCNDPHLNLSAPSIWYEIQLKSKDNNVYGYSIPGTPGVIVGFNEHVSWGITNGSVDVKDWYKLEINQDYSGYLFDGDWLPMKTRTERIKVKGGIDFIDTVRSTIHGPIVSDNSIDQLNSAKDCAMRWALSEATNEFGAIIRMNNSKSLQEFQSATKSFMFPSVNFVYADREGNIASFFRGAIWDKKQKYSGRQIYDGTSKDHLVKSWINIDSLPVIINPAENFVHTANNNPFTNNGSYVNGYFSELRANKIGSILRQKEKFSLKELKEMQCDNTNRLAELALPILMKSVDHSDKAFCDALLQWGGTYDKDSKLAVFFEDWWTQIEFKTWDELVRYGRFIKYPDDAVLLDLIQKTPNFNYFDKLNTEKTEAAADIISETFSDAYDVYHSKEQQKWGEARNIKLTHLANIDAFGKSNMVVGGHPEAINAFSENWGPSMRLIVNMGETITAYGIIAGGPSGNPGSALYDANISDWLSNKYYELHFYGSMNEGVKDAQLTFNL